MDPIGVLAIAAVLIALGAAVVALTRRLFPVSGTAVPTSIELLRSSIEDLRAANASALGEMRAELQRTLGATGQQMATQSGTTAKALTDLSRQLGALSEQSHHIGELAKDIGSLQDLLRAPKSRGGFGELMLERLLQDCLPASAYEVQYTYRDGSRVDAIVKYGNRIVPIDSKLPSESYTAIAGAKDDAERRSKRRAFLQQTRRHIDAVARYVSPQDGSIDFAFMYLPSEAMYYELTMREGTAEEPDLAAYFSEKHVIPASPNTLLAYLQVVSLGIRGLAMQERTRELQQGIAQVRREFESFADLHGQLGTHLDNAMKKFDQTQRALARASGAIEGLVQVPIAGGGEQEVLPLRSGGDER